MAKAKPEPGQRYLSLIEPIWESVSIYDGPAVFLRQFNSLRPEIGNLFAAHWCQSEVCNGGLHQFFANSTGVLAPEAVGAYRAMRLDEWAAIVTEAMSFFGRDYPRDRAARIGLLERVKGSEREDWDPFYSLDEQFYKWLDARKSRWECAADKYAASVGE